MIEDATGPIGLDVFVVRGALAKHKTAGVHEVDTQMIALLLGNRGQGIVGDELATMGCKFAFDVLGVDAMIFSAVSDIAENRANIAKRGFVEYEPMRQTKNGARRSVGFARADWATRIAADQAERDITFTFTP